MKQHAICIVSILSITFLFIFVAYILEPMLLDTYQPSLPGDLTMDQWLSSFRFWACVCVGAAVFAIFLWYVFGQTVFKTIHEKPNGKRGIWLSLFIIPVVAICLSIWLIEQPESEPLLAYMFFVVNALFPYYIATVLFSPASVKFTPIGAMQIRFW